MLFTDDIEAEHAEQVTLGPFNSDRDLAANRSGDWRPRFRGGLLRPRASPQGRGNDQAAQHGAPAKKAQRAGVDRADTPWLAGFRRLEQLHRPALLGQKTVTGPPEGIPL